MFVIRLSAAVALAALALAPPVHAGRVVWPCSARVTSDYGPRSSPCGGCSTFHHGIDLGVGTGTILGSPGNGTVTSYAFDSCGGNIYKIGYGGGWETRFLHCSASIRGVGSVVTRNVDVARSGGTGSCTTGPHLHFEVRKDGASQVVPGAVGLNVTRGNEVPQEYPGLNDAPPPPPGPLMPNQLEVQGDFNGDGKQDVAYRRNGWWNWVVNYGGNSGADGAGYLPPVGNDGHNDIDVKNYGTVALAGDFDGDGRTDIAWRNAGWSGWFLNAGNGQSGNGPADNRTDFDPRSNQMQVAGDFNNDGKTDIAWRRKAWVSWQVNLGGPGGPQSILPSNGNDGHGDFDPDFGQAAFTGDIDGDGRADIAWRKKSWQGWFLDSGNGLAGNGPGDGRTDFDPLSQQVQLVGDFNGDGKKDLAWRRTGWVNWKVNLGGPGGPQMSLPTSGNDSHPDFNTGDGLLAVAGDIDADGKMDILWRKTGWAGWYMNAGNGGHGNGPADNRTDFDPRGRTTIAWCGKFDSDARWDVVHRKAGWPESIVNFGAGGNDQGYMTDGRTDFDPRLF